MQPRRPGPPDSLSTNVAPLPTGCSSSCAGASFCEVGSRPGAPLSRHSRARVRPSVGKASALPPHVLKKSRVARNQRPGARIVMATGHSHPPSPPCLAGHPLGVVDLSATPKFLPGRICGGTSAGRRKPPKIHPSEAAARRRLDPGTSVLMFGVGRSFRRESAVRAVWRCVRRTKPGSRWPTPWPAETASRSGTPARAVRR